MLSKITKLSGKQVRKLRDAIISAFPDKARLKMMLRIELDKNLDEVAGGENLQIVVFSLIEWAESEGKLEKLVKSACEYNSGNQELQNIKKELSKLSSYIDITDNNYPIPIEEWRKFVSILNDINNFNLFSSICIITLENIVNNKDVLGNYNIDLNELKNCKNINSLENIFLKKCTYNNKGVPTIIEFAQRLAKEKEEKIQKNQLIQLETWITNITQSLGIKKLSSDEEAEYLTPKTFNSYLLVTAESKGNNKFGLKAELRLENCSNNSNNKPIKISDELNPEEGIIDCHLSEIANKIYEFTRICKRRLQQQYNSETFIIELFMPLEYLDKNIDNQEIPGGFGEQIAIGDKYKFIIRSRERITEEDGEFLDKLYRKCENFSHKFEDIPQKNSFQKWNWSACNFKQIENYWRDNSILGTKIICGLPENYKLKRQFFTSIIRAGVPICLWTRDENIPNIENQFNEIFTCTLESLHDLDALFKSVWKFRQKAYEEENKENYLGYHLGFWCDNPYRIPSCLELELIPTGE